MRIYNLDLSKNSRLDKVRDLFVIGCYTGLRYPDFTAIMPENIEGDVIRVKTKKTGVLTVIPFKGRLKEIYEKYGQKFPSAITNQRMNDYLKEIGLFANIDETIVVAKSMKGQRVEKIYKKHELLTAHCARRSFATNAYLAGIPSISIMKITGHKSEKVFMGYIRITQEENAQQLINHKFFN